jgi:peptide-methionine (S)-S-oxide reductase
VRLTETAALESAAPKSYALGHPLLLSSLLVVLLVAAVRGETDGAAAATLKKATFAGGCFWCMEPPFDALDGVTATTAGYAGGQTKNPTYQEVSAGGTGHAEAIQITYDPRKVTYEKLLDVFWHKVDPTTPNRQFCDVGSQYRSIIFYHDEEQKHAAEGSKQALDASQQLKVPIVTEIVAAQEFYPAEEYHQDYYQKNPIRYKYYRHGCGRDQRLRELWGAH